MKKTIVVVDDFESTRWVIENTLAQVNAEVLKAENGKEALAFFDGRRIDLLITDLNMPVMDGLQLVETVRKMPGYSIIPIVMLTTEVNPAKRQRAADVKITTWIQKPYKIEHFIKVVEKCLL